MLQALHGSRQNPPSTRIFFLVHAHGWTIFIFVFFLMAIVAAFDLSRRKDKGRTGKHASKFIGSFLVLA
jgi:hypothetical protein